MPETIDKRSLIQVRDATLDDLNFIYASWLKGLRYGNDWFRQIDQDAYYKAYHQVLEIILNRPSTAIKVACLVEDPSIIIGYSVFDKSILHWVFVKKPWRNIGICRDLIPTSIDVVTHVTKVGTALLPKLPGVRFNPFAS